MITAVQLVGYVGYLSGGGANILPPRLPSTFPRNGTQRGGIRRPRWSHDHAFRRPNCRRQTVLDIHAEMRNALNQWESRPSNRINFGTAGCCMETWPLAFALVGWGTKNPNKLQSQTFNLSNPKPGHTTGGSGPAAHGGAAGRGGPGRVGRRRVCSRRTQPSLVPARASKTTVLNNSPEERTKEILCKPLGEHSPRFTSGSSVFYQRFIRGLSPGREELFVPVC